MSIDDFRQFTKMDRQVLSLFVVIFFITFGEQLWTEYFPVYFTSLGGSILMLGVFKSLSDSLEAVSQLPGGMISDRLGRISASVVFLLMGILGYTIYLVAPSYKFLFVGVILVQGTSSLLQPTVFAIVGDNLEPEMRTSAFSVQSILKRLPIIIAPALGGFIIGKTGIIVGVRIGLSVTLALLLVGILTIMGVRNGEVRRDRKGVTLTLPRTLRPLLSSELFIRFGQGMVKVFLIIHVKSVVSLMYFGWLLSIQYSTSILSYFLAVPAVSRFGKKRVMVVSYMCFATYPVIILLSQNYPMLVLGYVVAGFREFGEPVRKGVIVDLSSLNDRQALGKDVGLYYSIRTVTVIPSAIIGAKIFEYSPSVLGLTATSVGIIGVLILIFLVGIDERRRPGQ